MIDSSAAHSTSFLNNNADSKVATNVRTINNKIKSQLAMRDGLLLILVSILKFIDQSKLKIQMLCSGCIYEEHKLDTSNQQLSSSSPTVRYLWPSLPIMKENSQILSLMECDFSKNLHDMFLLFDKSQSVSLQQNLISKNKTANIQALVIKNNLRKWIEDRDSRYFEKNCRILKQKRLPSNNNDDEDNFTLRTLSLQMEYSNQKNAAEIVDRLIRVLMNDSKSQSLSSSSSAASRTTMQNNMQLFWSIATSIEQVHDMSICCGKVMIDNFAGLFGYPKKKPTSSTNNEDNYDEKDMQNLSYLQALSKSELCVRCCPPEMLGLVNQDRCMMSIESDVWMFGVMMFEILAIDRDKTRLTLLSSSPTSSDYENAIHAKLLFPDCKSNEEVIACIRKDPTKLSRTMKGWFENENKSLNSITSSQPIPSVLSDLIVSCCNWSRDHRPSMSQVSSTLSSIVSSLSISIQSSSSSSKASPVNQQSNIDSKTVQPIQNPLRDAAATTISQPSNSQDEQSQNNSDKIPTIKPISKEELQAIASTSNSNDFEWDVFLSYAGEDRFDKHVMVAAVFLFLTALGIKCWYDQDSIDRCGLPNSAEQIKQGLMKSKMIICFVTENYLSKKWPQLEFSTAHYHQKSKIYPMFLASDQEIDWNNSGWVYQQPDENDNKTGTTTAKDLTRIGSMIRKYAGQPFEFDRSKRVIELALSIKKQLNLTVGISSSSSSSSSTSGLTMLLSPNDPYDKNRNKMRELFELICKEVAGAWNLSNWNQPYILNLSKILKQVSFEICDSKHETYSVQQFYHHVSTSLLSSALGSASCSSSSSSSTQGFDQKASTFSTASSSSSSGLSMETKNWKTWSVEETCAWILNVHENCSPVVQHFRTEKLNGRYLKQIRTICQGISFAGIHAEALFDAVDDLIR